jgi:uncharacterized DUF497 family protein
MDKVLPNGVLDATPQIADVMSWGERLWRARRGSCYTLCITMRFEWDEEKNRTNEQKHGIAFSTAARIFNDPFVLFRKDRVVTGEQRWHAIGTVDRAVLLVVHMYIVEEENAEEETIRIISAREADKRERRIYIQQATE